MARGIASGMNYLSGRNFIHRVSLTFITGVYVQAGTPELGGRRGSCPPCLLLGGARGAKVPFKYKEYCITVSFQGAFS